MFGVYVRASRLFESGRGFRSDDASKFFKIARAFPPMMTIVRHVKSISRDVTQKFEFAPMDDYTFCAVGNGVAGFFFLPLSVGQLTCSSKYLSPTISRAHFMGSIKHERRVA